ncbi:lipase family protein [Rhodococcus sp. NPDC056960]|uniref:lipase family protein n=1 Tax=Rhodococcus sp. NPDC056960 TaxID=3345982 RepID=UPI00362EC843
MTTRMQNTRAGRHRRSIIRSLCVATAVVVAAAIGGTSYADPVGAPQVLTPDRDPFYAPPPNLGAYANGAILGSRPSALYGLPLPINVWQIQYKSSDADNRPTTGVTTVMVPDTPWTGAGPRPVVSYQMAEDGLGIQCASSYVLRAGVQAGLQNGQDPETPVATALLQRNWAVVVSDYEGPQERFLDRDQEAHSNLDGIRAALAFAPAALSPSAPVAAFGYSGGAFATAATMEMQPRYAPELNVAGFAAGGIPADLLAAIAMNNGTHNAGLAAIALAALDRLSPEANVAAQFDDASRTAIATASNQCVQQVVNANAGRLLYDASGQSDLAGNPAIQAAAGKQNLGRAVPTAPMYAWHSGLDDALPLPSTDALIDRYCAAGATVSYHRTDVQGHAAAAVAEIPAAFDYLNDRLTGRPVQPGCNVF